MSADEARLFRLYGKLPNKKDLLQNKLKVRFEPQLIDRENRNLTMPVGAQIFRQRRLRPLQGW
jgi:hypothetical protein